MPKIKHLVLAAGPAGSIQPGQTVDVDDDTARDRVAGGYAIDVTPPRKAPQPEGGRAVEAIESATVGQPETTARRRYRQ